MDTTTSPHATRTPARSKQHSAAPETSLLRSDSPTLHYSVHGSFVVTHNGLRALESIFRKFVAGGGSQDDHILERVVVVEGNAPPREFKSIQPVLQLRNSKSEPINRLFFSLATGKRQVHFWFDSQGSFNRYAAVVKASAASADHLSPMFGELRRELRNLKPWYSLARTGFDWTLSALARIPPAFWTIILVVPAILFVIFGLVVVLYAAWTQFTSDPGVSPTITARPPQIEPSVGELSRPDAPSRLLDEPTASEESTFSWKNVQRFVPLMMAVLVGLFGPPTMRFIFPRVVFEIGEGIERHQHVIWVRRFLLCTIGLGAIVIPTLLAMLTGSTG